MNNHQAKRIKLSEEDYKTCFDVNISTDITLNELYDIMYNKIYEQLKLYNLKYYDIGLYDVCEYFHKNNINNITFYIEINKEASFAIIRI